MHHGWQLTASLIALVGIGCGTDLPCDGPEADCECVVDSDCELTLYGELLTNETECSAIECACQVALNDVAAARNEQSWVDAGCVEDVQLAECADCAPGYSEHPACVDLRCTKVKQGGGEDNQPRPGEYL